MAGLLAPLLLLAGGAGDPLTPSSRPQDARVSPLAMVTVGTADMAQARRFYASGLGMRCAAGELREGDALTFRRHHDMQGRGPLQVLMCDRPDVPGTVRVRILALPASVPQARPDHDARLTGGLSMGFPTSGNRAADARVQASGFTSSAGLTAMTLPDGKGGTYQVGEVHWLAPDGVYALGIDRGRMAPVGAVDPALGVGGPAYSGMMTGSADRRLFAGVLGLEPRRVTEFASSGPTGGLGLPSGTRFAFEQWFSPGATTGYVILMQLKGGPVPAPVALGFKARGLTGWAFTAADLADIARRAGAAGVPAGPVAEVPLGDGSRVRSIILKTADGFPVEIIEAPR